MALTDHENIRNLQLRFDYLQNEVQNVRDRVDRIMSDIAALLNERDKK